MFEAVIDSTKLNNRVRRPDYRLTLGSAQSHLKFTSYSIQIDFSSNGFQNASSGRTLSILPHRVREYRSTVTQIGESPLPCPKKPRRIPKPPTAEDPKSQIQVVDIPQSPLS